MSKGGGELSFRRKIPKFLAALGVRAEVADDGEPAVAVDPQLEDRDDASDEKPVVVDESGKDVGDAKGNDQEEVDEDKAESKKKRVAQQVKKRRVVGQEDDVVDGKEDEVKKKSKPAPKRSVGLSFADDDD